MDSSVVSQSVEERLTKEEWEAVNKLLSFQPDEDLGAKDLPNMIHYMFIVSISKAAARIVNINDTEIVCGRFENLHVSTKFKHRSTQCDLTLQYYGLSAPEGSLAQVCLYVLLPRECMNFLNDFVNKSPHDGHQYNTCVLLISSI